MTSSDKDASLSRTGFSFFPSPAGDILSNVSFVPVPCSTKLAALSTSDTLAVILFSSLLAFELVCLVFSMVLQYREVRLVTRC